MLEMLRYLSRRIHRLFKNFTKIEIRIKQKVYKHRELPKCLTISSLIITSDTF